MGQIQKTRPVKLFVGLLARQAELLPAAEKILVRKFGPVDCRSPIWPFTWTDYYRRELGSDIKRQFIGFLKLIKPDSLAGCKIFTNNVETRLSDKQGRRLNIDPGYLDQAKVVLATTKDFTHRLYQSRGIWAEVTLHYVRDAWQIWPWTYPDYATAEYQRFFTCLRELYQKQLLALAEASG